MFEKSDLSAKELALIDLLKQEIQSIDNSLSKWYYQNLATIGAGGVFAYQIFPNHLNSIIGIGLIFLALLIHGRFVDLNHISELYDSLRTAIIQRKLHSFKIKQRSWREMLGF